MAKMTNCKSCGKEIAASAKTCPHCGAKNKKPFYKAVWFWVIILIVIILSHFVDIDDNGNKTSKSNVTNQIQEKEAHQFLEGTNSDDFSEILKGVTGIDNLDSVISEELISYTGENSDYNIKIIANKDTKEIGYVRITAFTSEDATNVFMSLTRMNYITENKAAYTDWLVNNVGKESTTKIGKSIFRLTLDSNNNSILEMQADGGKGYIEQ